MTIERQKGAIAKVHEALDAKLKDKVTGKEIRSGAITRADLVAQLVATGLNKGTVNVQIAKWAEKNGIEFVRKPKEAKAEAKPKEAKAKAEAKADTKSKEDAKKAFFDQSKPAATAKPPKAPAKAAKETPPKAPAKAPAAARAPAKPAARI